MSLKSNLTALLILVFALFSINSSHSQSGWEIQNSGTLNNLSYINFINANTGFIGNPLMKTTNGGVNWPAVTGAPSVNMVFFVDNNTGYSSSGTVYKSTNSGYNWINLNQIYRNRIFFIDKDTGYATGSYEWDPGMNQFVTKLLKTTNGGSNWTVSMQLYQDPYVHIVFDDVIFKSSSTGYFVILVDDSFNENGISYIYRTTDYGTSWFYLFGSDSLNFYSIKYPSPDTAYFLAKKNFYHNYNNLPNAVVFKIVNDNTISIVLTLNDKFLYGIHFVNGSTGYAVGDAGTILKTTNGGLDWYTQNSGITSKLSQVCFVNSTTGYIVGDSGIVLKTVNSGEPFNTVSGTIRYKDNNQIVTEGYVKALKFEPVTLNMICVDSAGIQSNGSYSLHHCPGDSLYIMAFQDDESDQMFVATYYISATQWQTATKIFPDHNLTNIDIFVYRINNIPGLLRIGGTVLAYTNTDNSVVSVKDAVVYAIKGGSYNGYSVTNDTGRFQVDSLTSGNFYLIVDRIGYYEVKKIVSLSNTSIDTVIIYLNSPVGIEKNNYKIPVKFNLLQNYPNPFNPVTFIRIEIPLLKNSSMNRIELTVYDDLGRKVETIFEGYLNAGRYLFSWNGENYSSGVYFYRLQAGDFKDVKKMVLIK